MTASLLVSVGLIFVVEGLLYAMAPDGMKRMIATMLSQTNDQLRFAGVLAVAFGVLVVWLARAMV
jgi:uncharacterized protein